MANTNVFLSPGVFTREFDLSFLPMEIPAVGAAVIGPTVRGPAMVPTPVSTYSEYLRWFGDVFSSGSGASEREYKYLTTYTVQEYLRWGQVCTVVRILAGNYQPAYSYVNSLGGTAKSFKIVSLSDGETVNSGQISASLAGSGSTSDYGTNGLLVIGSRYNIQWEIANVDTNRGVFDF